MKESKRKIVENIIAKGYDRFAVETIWRFAPKEIKGVLNVQNANINNAASVLQARIYHTSGGVFLPFTTVRKILLSILRARKISTMVDKK